MGVGLQPGSGFGGVPAEERCWQAGGEYFCRTGPAGVCVLRWGWGWGSWVREMVPAIRLFLEKCPKDPCFSGTHFEIRKQIFLPCGRKIASCCFCVLHPAASVPFLRGAAVPLRVGTPCLSLSSSSGSHPLIFLELQVFSPPDGKNL